MINTLHSAEPTARKEHRCSFCNGLIHIGEKYNRDTLICNGIIYDWISHKHCKDMVNMLEMEPYDEGVDSECFCESVESYVNTEHIDKEADDVEKDWQGKTIHELVEMIWDEKHKNDSNGE